jgi:hypothetical protein
VTGVEPVRGTEPGTDPPMHASETEAAFLARRTAELMAEGRERYVAESIAQGEWRVADSRDPGLPHTASPGARPAAYAQEPCPGCGTMKLPTEQCRDCGSRPII